MNNINWISRGETGKMGEKSDEILELEKWAYNRLSSTKKADIMLGQNNWDEVKVEVLGAYKYNMKLFGNEPKMLEAYKSILVASNAVY